MQHRRRSPLTALVAASLTLVLAACGSTLDPETVRMANGAAGGSYDGAAVGGELTGDGDLGPATAGEGPGAGPAATGGSGATVGDAAGPGATGGDAAQGSGENSATGGAKAGSCDGFKNQTGITGDKIVIANAADISGPVPGLFESAQQAVKAYVAYFNATSDICGRKLELLELDSRTDAGADQQAYARACESAFAAIGSMSAFDSGGAATAAKCGLPDLRSANVSNERQACATCFGVQSANPGTFQNAVPDHIIKNYPQAAKNAAYVWINAGVGPLNAQNQARAMERRGMRFVYKQGIDVSEFNYRPYVQAMQDKGVQYVQFLGAYQQAERLAKAMQEQGFKPMNFVLDPTGYDPRYVQSGGAAVEGTRIFINIAMFEEARSNPEMALYQQWLQQVKPGATPTFFGVFSWSAARLFVEQSIALGGRLTRQTLVDSVKRVDNWTSNGLHSPQHVGSKETGDCWRWIRLEKGRWVPDGPTRYTCSGVTKAD
ncbi:MAG TPA: ABC transporter substrate-binding protein [Nocardioides sp.]|nr:ABC transporter substrate-binding protein [Nocardioides sp.]